MRLTLRTLLAYRDKVLDPKDSQILEQRIRDSGTARSIAQRIEAVVANARLNPIPVDAREFGLDPNDVASFLDDAMTSERLPEMERKCLENSALLAEVASCHQILARAIAVPVNVSPMFRNRILDFQRRVSEGDLPRPSKLRGDGGHGSTRPPHLLMDASKTDDPSYSAAQGSPPSFETREGLPASLPQNRRPIQGLGGAGIELDDRLGAQVPEYLRGTDRQWISSTIRLLLLLALLGYCALQAMGPWERMAQLLDRTPPRPSSSPPNEEPSVGPAMTRPTLTKPEMGLAPSDDSIIVSPTLQEPIQ
jgi:hypothetical protein